VLIVLVLIMMMGTTLVYLGTHNLNQIRTSGRQTTLRHAADGGLHELLDTLYQNPDYGQDQTASSSVRPWLVNQSSSRDCSSPGCIPRDSMNCSTRGGTLL
jgi:hypothetical protein